MTGKHRNRSYAPKKAKSFRTLDGTIDDKGAVVSELSDDLITTHFCTSCNTRKNVSEFSTKPKISSWCKECTAQYTAGYVQANKTHPIAVYTAAERQGAISRLLGRRLTGTTNKPCKLDPVMFLAKRKEHEALFELFHEQVHGDYEDFLDMCVSLGKDPVFNKSEFTTVYKHIKATKPVLKLESIPDVTPVLPAPKSENIDGMLKMLFKGKTPAQCEEVITKLKPELQDAAIVYAINNIF